jgi:hypothetical protein
MLARACAGNCTRLALHFEEVDLVILELEVLSTPKRLQKIATDNGKGNEMMYFLECNYTFACALTSKTRKVKDNLLRRCCGLELGDISADLPFRTSCPSHSSTLPFDLRALRRLLPYHV